VDKLATEASTDLGMSDHQMGRSGEIRHAYESRNRDMPDAVQEGIFSRIKTKKAYQASKNIN